jgi:chemotaxis protein methyltransferase CheR
VTAVDAVVLADDPAFAALKEYVIAVTGLAYYRSRDAFFSSRVAERLLVTGTRGCEEYLRVLRARPGGSAELDALVVGLTIGETSFFRHREMFEALVGRVLPDVLRRKHATRSLRVWSAGCSIGAEPYTVSILLRRHFGAEIAGWKVEILGTDINRRFLAQAQAGRYETWTLRGVPEDVRDACFRMDGTGWVLTDPYRRDVHFQYYNLLDHPVPSLANNLVAFDVILCRNVLIYFDRSVARALAGRLRACLVEGGWLLVGHAEPAADVFEEFEAVHEEGAVLYRTAAAGRPRAEAFGWWRRGGEGEGVPSAADMPLSPAAASPRRPDVAGGLAGAAGDPTARAVASGWRGDPPARVGAPAEGSVEAVVAPGAAPAVSACAARLAEMRRMANRGEHRQALDVCREVLEGRTGDAELHLTHAMLLMQLGCPEDAVASLRRALYLDQKAALPHYILGLTRLRQGRRGEAARSFANVRTLLAALPPADPIPGSDGLTVAALDRLARMHMEMAR